MLLMHYFSSLPNYCLVCYTVHPMFVLLCSKKSFVKEREIKNIYIVKTITIYYLLMPTDILLEDGNKRNGYTDTTTLIFLFANYTNASVKGIIGEKQTGNNLVFRDTIFG